MVIGINCGHTLEGPGSGAVGLFRESVHTRLVGNALMKKFTDAGVEVIDCTVDRASSQEAYLERTVAMANQSKAELFVSIHFNASGEHMAQGVEVYTYQGKQHLEATEVCSRIAGLGFANRGIKDGSGLYVIRKTTAKALLVEVCFCDHAEDAKLYYHVGAHETIAETMFNALYETMADKEPMKREKRKLEFIEFVGKISARDWRERRIMLPSVVVAQAIKESSWGTSELAREANALFGIKKNGWNGKTYTKNALEQKPDGTYYEVKQTEWRAYDNWEQSILDHNDYIAERSTDGGKTLRYASVIGCCDYIRAARCLQECGYATAHGYAESLIRDYIEKYHLAKFDN